VDHPIVTKFEFTLPVGYLDEDGALQRQGIMRLATAADEIFPLRDPRVQSNPAYLSILILQRVIVKLGTHDAISTHTIESLYSKDFNYLQDLYNKVNGLDDASSAGLPTAASLESTQGNVQALPLQTSFTQR
jgi:hypothetical protein